jgi:hypothetical protein
VSDPGHLHSIARGFGASGSGGDALLSGTGVNSATATTGISVSTTNTATGVSGTNANLPPYLGINFIIKT